MNFFKLFFQKADDIEIKNTPKQKTNKLKCAIVIGHKSTSKGAYNKTYDISEFNFNESIAKDIEIQTIAKDIDVDIIRIYRRTYSSLPHDINELKPDFIISLHCNAFNKVASGSEVLYYHRSDMGKTIANILQKNFVNYLGLTDRGVHGKSSEDRGGYLLKKTNSPCIIAEPFFIDNDNDYEKISNSCFILVNAYVESIKEIATLIRRGN